MKPVALLVAGSLTAVSACVPAPAPTPIPTVVPTRPAAVPTPSSAPAVTNWLDAPQTPGDWRYSGNSSGSIAEFGNGAAASFTIRCDRAARSVILTRNGVPAGPQQMTVRAESQFRTLPASGGPNMLTARLPASDTLLDAMALSKGRFAVEVTGMPTLYLPSWAEVTRVIEDCR